MGAEEKIFLNKEEALRIAQFYNNTIHCFSVLGVNMIIGATWDAKNFKKELNKAKAIEVGGEICRNMKHALAIHTSSDIYFFEHKEKELEKLLKEKGVE